MLQLIDSLDCKIRNEQAISLSVTAEALPNIMQRLLNDGNEFVTVSELLTIQQKRDEDKAIYIKNHL